MRNGIEYRFCKRISIINYQLSTALVPELLLHYIWQQKAFLAFPQMTTDGRQVEVIDVGQHNTDAGPDFFNAKIRIGGVLWSGNVEIHVLASDWYKHQHQTDPAYDNIILHVVRKADKRVYNTKGGEVMQCELKYPDNPKLLEQLLVDRLTLCNDRISRNPDLVTDRWKECLLRERLTKKEDAIRQLLALSHNNWEEAFYITLAHNFGFHTNGLPFELLAKQTPLPFLLKHRNSLFQLEAILFGQSGLLQEQTAQDDYSRGLLQEYRFLQKKFSLVPIEASLWKLLRMRPQNFPHIRIAQFAALLYQTEHLLAEVVAEDDIDRLRQLFISTPSDYWRTHYRFAASCPETDKTIGKSALDILLINTAIPYKYAYARSQDNNISADRFLRLLAAVPAEKNHIIARWKLIGLKVKNAADSQAFIHLYQNYCLSHRCINCEVGYQIFTVNYEETNT